MSNNVKEFIIIHCAEVFKSATSFIMFFTAGLMVYDREVDGRVIPDYFHFTEHDWWVWLILLTTVGLYQLILLKFVESYRLRLVGDLTLQFSGLLLLFIGWVFIAKYPPLNTLMFFYPTWGILMILSGRHMGKRSRIRYQKYKELQGV